jgi:hypothetical protein
MTLKLKNLRKQICVLNVHFLDKIKLTKLNIIKIIIYINELGINGSYY